MTEDGNENAAQRMFDGDALMRSFGAELDDLGNGTATLSLTVADNMVQAHGTCHGGTIFALADAAFGVACNSGAHPAVAQQCSINYLRPANVGDRLTVEVARRSESGRTGVYDGSVMAEDRTLIAEFRGISRSLPPRD
ncbi:hydroxyphenylacetyl-CoA thioesterase PaaI [Notoacmeibacter marinus]|uniref:hydroxyphenylacetyl-CoA thioesterase PaaI n=1 Tax=Notoacmeibacter marinus TaxID=1876515 RepID=UPI001964F762|nr:hydroxyphenylacetyl-CoA thioesterase PaaI [Notoacmeibacter marinus]